MRKILKRSGIGNPPPRRAIAESYSGFAKKMGVDKAWNLTLTCELFCG